MAPIRRSVVGIRISLFIYTHVSTQQLTDAASSLDRSSIRLRHLLALQKRPPDREVVVEKYGL